MKRGSQGFTLVTVLILTSMATVVVLSSLRDSVIQERLSGNYQKKLNARMMAEKGVYDSMNALLFDIQQQPDISVADLVKNNSQLTAQSDLASSQYSAAISIDDDGNIVVSSKGERFEGQEQMQAVFEFVAGSSGSGGGADGSPFAPGVSGCSGAVVTGSGSIDSYDSSLGDYAATLPDGSINKSQHAFVNSLYDDGDITLNGAGNVEGDVLASGNLSITGGARVSGNIHSNGDLKLAGGVYVGGNASAYKAFSQGWGGEIVGNISANEGITLQEIKVGGDVRSRSTINVTGNRVAGAVRSYSNVNLSQATILGGVFTKGNYAQRGGTTSGGVRVQGNVTLQQWGSVISADNLRYSGIGSFKGDTQKYYDPPYKSASLVAIDDVPLVARNTFSDGNGEAIAVCDMLNIADEINNTNDSAITASSLNISSYGRGDSLEFATLEANYLVNNASTPIGKLTPVTGEFLGRSTNLFYFDNVSVNGHVSVKEGHNAVWFVRGDFTMGGASSLTIADNSSLTVIIQGKLKIGAGAQVHTPDQGVTAQGRPVFSIYSAYSGSKAGIEFSGGTRELYAVIYAPYTQVNVTSAVGFKGSILGDTVNVTGAGGVHYDTALGEASFGGEIAEPVNGRLVFKEWRFVYDNE
ncbi:PilX N-terminal domain-containing pilus assembly protein [Pseudoalteromonas mariniglutinosa]|uniref:DUF7305 domain-containing protein n=1 Tax=Pseudoalteromonas mariniglutinosa TaxID=206042 RepID=UPI00384BC2A7